MTLEPLIPVIASEGEAISSFLPSTTEIASVALGDLAMTLEPLVPVIASEGEAISSFLPSTTEIASVALGDLAMTWGAPPDPRQILPGKYGGRELEGGGTSN